MAQGLSVRCGTTALSFGPVLYGDPMFEIIDPLNYPGYDQLVRDANGSIFHSSNWAAVLVEAYRYTPLYFVGTQHGKLTSLIPIMEVDSLLTGRRGVSLPFTDYCDPIIVRNDKLEEQLDTIMKYGSGAGWKSVEFRTGNRVPSKFLPSVFFYAHTIDLTRTEEQIFQGLRDSTKRNIRKAAREGVTISFENSQDSLKEFYRLNCITRKCHGLPPQPYSFFRKVYEHILSRNLGHIVLASHMGKNIAGAIFFHFGGQAVYKYGASEKDDQNRRANNLVMWSAIQWYCLNGYKSLSLGRTESGNPGLLQFKRGWGPEESIINYYKFDLKKNAFVREAPMVAGFHNRIFGTIPMTALRLTGSLLYRHMG